MSRYAVDGIILDTTKATARWEEDTEFDGHNHISKATGSQWNHETLYRSAKGRYYIEHTSQQQGARPSATIVTQREAAAWLLANDEHLPDDLAHIETDITE